MSKLFVTTLTVIAAAGCAAPATEDAVDDEPPPSSTRPIKHVADAVASPSEKHASAAVEATGAARSPIFAWPPPPFAASDEEP
jgi:hypothetical protein